MVILGLISIYHKFILNGQLLLLLLHCVIHLRLKYPFEKMLANISRGWRRQFSHPEMQRPPASISGCNGSIRDVVDIFGCLRHPKMHEAIQDARSNSGCARILNCFMHLGMLEAIEIRMEIVSGNFRCLSISNCGFPAPDVHRDMRDPLGLLATPTEGHVGLP